ncbi:MAG: hypothetical protein ABH842_05475 [Candidatus Micrarchaeota archaeon]
MKTLADFRKDAHKITKSGKPAKITWSELRNWASAKGPVAMKAAIMEFVHSYRNSSDLGALMPELMKSATFSPYEQKALIQIASYKPELIEKQDSSYQKIIRPQTYFQLDPKDRTLSAKPQFTNDPRLDIFLMREKNQALLSKPNMFEGRWEGVKKPKFQAHSMDKSSGEHVLRRLVENIQSHSSNGIEPKKKLTKKKPRLVKKHKKAVKKKIVKSTKKSTKKIKKRRK